MAQIVLKRRDFARAVDLIAAAVETDVELRTRAVQQIYAEVLLRQSRDPEVPFASARARYARALSFRPDWPLVRRRFAELLATHPDARRTDGERAIEHALAIARDTPHPRPADLALLADAQARAGRFDAALHTARQARARAMAEADARFAAQLDERIALYEAGNAFDGKRW